MCTAIVTFRDESGETYQGELVSPFQVANDGLLYLMGKDGDPLAYTIATALGEDILFCQVERERVERIETFCI